MSDEFIICDNIDECLRELELNPYLAVAVSRKHAINCPTIAREKIFCFKKTENVHSIAISMLTRRGYYLLPKMNTLLRQLIENGLFTKWERDTTFIVQETDTWIKTNLNLEHFVGCFVFSFIGIATSIGTFVVEIFIHRLLKNRRNNRFLQLAEELIDGKRHYFA